MSTVSHRRRTQLRWWAGRGPAAVLAAVLGLLAAPLRGAGSVTHPLPMPGMALRFDGHGAASVQGAGLIELPLLEGSSNETITVSVWARIEKHKTHNLLASSGSREAGWALFVDKGEQALFGLWQQRSLRTVSTRPLQQGSAWHFISGSLRRAGPACVGRRGHGRGGSAAGGAHGNSLVGRNDRRGSRLAAAAC